MGPHDATLPFRVSSALPLWHMVAVGGGSSPPRWGRAAPTSAGLRPLKLAAPYSGNGGGPHVPLGITSPSPSPQDTLLPAAPMAAAELTPVEMAIETIVSVFVSHAGKEGRMGTLTATAFQELLRLQLPNLMKVRGGCGGLGVTVGVLVSVGHSELWGCSHCESGKAKVKTPGKG